MWQGRWDKKEQSWGWKTGEMGTLYPAWKKRAWHPVLCFHGSFRKSLNGDLPQKGDCSPLHLGKKTREQKEEFKSDPQSNIPNALLQTQGATRNAAVLQDLYSCT